MKQRAVLAVIAAAALFGTSASAKALLLPDASPTAIAGWRLLVGALGLLVIAYFTGGGLTRLLRVPLIYPMAIAVAGYQALFFIGTERTGVAMGTLASLALAPFLAGVLGWTLREGAPGRIWAISTVLAVIGLGLLTLTGGADADGLGILAAFGAGASYAVYTVLGARLTRDGHNSTAVLAVSFTIGAILLLPFIAGDFGAVMTPAGIGLILWLGLGATALAYYFFGVGLRSLQPGHVATLNLAEPVVATLLGVIVLGEILTGWGWAGCMVIVAALALLGLSERDRSQLPSPRTMVK